ncbi:MAG: SHOCT domain-containing protein [Liquorilactobacillus satsumensis]|uniref:SHOCT domain-containing protein n=1 Tax=Lactobacillaceae TaxID=33958 RepID=UPI0039E7CF61
MEIENKIIIRRLIAGILLIMMAAFCVYEAFTVINFGQEYNIQKMISAGGGGIVIGIFAFIVGLIFIVTSKTRPIKTVEYSISVLGVVIFIFTGLINRGRFFIDLPYFRWGLLLLMSLGLPFKNGFKDMPFISESEAKKKTVPVKQPVKKTVVQAVKEPSKNEDLSQLVELKKLLDSGVITKKDFDAKKKQILGL